MEHGSFADLLSDLVCPVVQATDIYAQFVRCLFDASCPDYGVNHL